MVCTTCFREQLPRCVWEAEGGADARAAGRATAPPASPCSLCHHPPSLPTPRAAATHGDPPGAGARTDGWTGDVRGAAIKHGRRTTAVSGTRRLTIDALNCPHRQLNCYPVPPPSSSTHSALHTPVDLTPDGRWLRLEWPLTGL